VLLSSSGRPNFKCRKFRTRNAAVQGARNISRRRPRAYNFLLFYAPLQTKENCGARELAIFSYFMRRCKPKNAAAPASLQFSLILCAAANQRKLRRPRACNFLLFYAPPFDPQNSTKYRGKHPRRSDHNYLHIFPPFVRHRLSAIGLDRLRRAAPPVKSICSRPPY